MAGSIEVLAHQGGWDELLFVAVPIVILVVLLRIANGRAAHLQNGPAAAADREAGTAEHRRPDAAHAPDRPVDPGSTASSDRD